MRSLLSRSRCHSAAISGYSFCSEGVCATAVTCPRRVFTRKPSYRSGDGHHQQSSSNSRYTRQHRSSRPNQQRSFRMDEELSEVSPLRRKQTRMAAPPSHFLAVAEAAVYAQYHPPDAAIPFFQRKTEARSPATEAVHEGGEGSPYALSAAVAAARAAIAYTSHWNSSGSGQQEDLNRARSSGHSGVIIIEGVRGEANHLGNADAVNMDDKLRTLAGRDHAVGDSPSLTKSTQHTRKAMWEHPPTPIEETEAAAMAMVIQWVLLAAAAADPSSDPHFPLQDGEKYLDALEEVLLLSRSRSPSDSTGGKVFSPSPVLHRSLARRAAKGYLDLLTERCMGPPSESAWQRLCAVLTLSHCDYISVAGAASQSVHLHESVPSSTADAVAVLPLFPSAFLISGGPIHKARDDRASMNAHWRQQTSSYAWKREGGGNRIADAPPMEEERELRMLAATLAAQQAATVVRWAAARLPSRTHLSSLDIQYALAQLARRGCGRENEREEGGGDCLDATEAAGKAMQHPLKAESTAASCPRSSATCTMAELIALWQRARVVEQADRPLARTCGLDRTAHDTIAVKGMTAIVTSSSAAAGATATESDSSIDAAVDMPSSADLNERILRGEWRGVLSTIIRYAAAVTGGGVNDEACGGAKKDRIESERCAARDEQLRLSIGGTIHAPFTVLRRFFRSPAAPRNDSNHGSDTPSCSSSSTYRVAVPLFADPRHQLRYNLPSEYAKGPLTSEEVDTLAHRRCAAVDHLAGFSLPSLSSAAPTSNEDGERARIVRQRLADWHTHEVAAGRNPTAPPTPLVELRRRLWLLAQLPAHLPRSLVRFGNASPLHKTVRTHTNNTNRHECATTATAPTMSASAPYLLREPRRELLPWLLVAFAGLTVEGTLAATDSGKTDSTTAATAELLAAVRDAIAPTLFSPNPEYAALHDYVGDLLLHLGTLTTELVVEQHRVRVREAKAHQERKGEKKRYSEAAQLAVWVRAAEEALFHFALVVLQPPPSPEVINHHLPSTASDALCIATLVVTRENYWASLYLEVLAQLAPSLAHYAAAIHKLKGTTTAMASREIEERKSEHMCGVVHGPEAAAAITTALVLRLLPTTMSQATDTRSCGSCSEFDPSASTTTEASVIAMAAAVTVNRDGKVWFAVRADQAPALPALFKAVYDAEYITEVPLEKSVVAMHSTSALVTVSDAEESAALLMGRSLRILSRHPTSSTEALFSITRTATGVTLTAPHYASMDRMAYRLFAVDIATAVKCFAARAALSIGDSRQKGNRVNRGDGCRSARCHTVATNLPYGLCAVYKPPHVNTTLHAAYDTLISYLLQRGPWDCRPVTPMAAAATAEPLSMSSGISRVLANATLPVRHQHGLINRLDVGTSGLVLVAGSPVALHRGRMATLIHHNTRKVYRALVQYCPPLPPRSSSSSYSLLSRHGQQQCSSSTHGARCRLWFLPPSGTISSAVAAAGTDAAAMSSVVPAPQITPEAMDRRPALTHFRVLESFPKHHVSHVEVTLRSGRKHQIRQHMAQLHHPLLGDDRYHPRLYANQRNRRAVEMASAVAAVDRFFDRPALHAYGIDVTGEMDGEGERVVVTCPVPADMQRALRWLRRGERHRARKDSTRANEMPRCRRWRTGKGVRRTTD